MEVPVESRGPRLTHCALRAQVKTGCRTCKVRKVKCDEDRPACRRCVSTGRVCDGYGIWGNGGNFYGQRQLTSAAKDSHTSLARGSRVSIFTDSVEEQEFFDWFKCRTSKKLPGTSPSAFWNTLVYQASVNEPAVLHAVLTLSSVHRREIYDTQAASTLDSQEQFTLQHYAKAIRHLQPHFSINDKASTRVALITCFLFICLELLRGHFATAQTHLQHGLKIVKELGTSSRERGGIFIIDTLPESIDDTIVKAFSRLQLQVELFRYSSQQQYFTLYGTKLKPAIPFFHSFYEASRQIEQIFVKIFRLSLEARRQWNSSGFAFGSAPSLLDCQREIQDDLFTNSAALVASRDVLESQDSTKRGRRLLGVHHILATIMLDTCLWPGDESIYDSKIEQFISIVDQSIDLWKIGADEFGREYRSRSLPGSHIYMSRSIIDVGWIAPLYYTALKCRAHRVRLHALRLMASTSHREGIWDSKVCTWIARQVIKIEEADIYKDLGEINDFLLTDTPSLQDLKPPMPPKSLRIHNMQVTLSDNVAEKITLRYQKGPLGWQEVHLSHSRK